LQFERGDITLYGWVPVRIKMTGLFSNEQLEKLKLDFRGCAIVTHETGQAVQNPSRSLEGNGTSATEAHSAKGRFKNISFDRFITMEYGDDSDKMQIYEQLLKSMIKNQWDWIVDNSIGRLVDGQNAVESLRIAVLSTTLAKCY